MRRRTPKAEPQARGKTDALAGLLQEAAGADVDYRVAYAKALLASGEKTVADREASATLETDRLGLLRDRKVKEAVADAAKESVRSLRDQLSAVQSANANVRFQAGLS
jgi:hypothetical protein